MATAFFVQEGLENREHILRNCDEAIQIWKSRLSNVEFQRQNQMGFDDWLIWNLTKVKNDIYTNWKEIVIITFWWM